MNLTDAIIQRQQPIVTALMADMSAVASFNRHWTAGHNEKLARAMQVDPELARIGQLWAALQDSL